MLDFFGRKRREREQKLEMKVKILVSLLNDLLWNLDTLPMCPEFRANWEMLKNLEKED